MEEPLIMLRGTQPVTLRDKEQEYIESSNPLPVTGDVSIVDSNGNEALVNEDGKLNVTLYDVGGIPAEVDNSTHSIQTIIYEHHEIHSGSYYRAGFQKDIPNGGTSIFAITTPDTTKWLHFRPAVDVELEAQIMLYENPTSVTGGTSITPRNANRNSTNTSDAIVVTDPTVNTTDAIVLGNLVEGSGKSSGGESSSQYEWVLKQNTTYVLMVINNATGNNQVNIRCQWYEHQDKN